MGPLYEYQCPVGHVSELMVKLSEKPAETTCTHEGCHSVAKPIMSATPTSFRQNDRKAFKRQGH
jgi:predicted nucleic acid-binding Zn ribbon protein